MAAIMSLFSLLLVTGVGGSSHANLAAAVAAEPSRTMAPMDYWQAALPETPMPQAIRDLLNQSTGTRLCAPLDDRRMGEGENVQGVQKDYPQRLEFVNGPRKTGPYFQVERKMQKFIPHSEEDQKTTVSYGSQGEGYPRKTTVSYGFQGEDNIRKVIVAYGLQAKKKSSNIEMAYGFDPPRKTSMPYQSQGKDEPRKVKVTYGSQDKKDPRKTTVSYGFQGEDNTRKAIVAYGLQAKKKSKNIEMAYGFDNIEDPRKTTVSYQSQGEDEPRKTTVSYGPQGEEKTTSYGSQNENDDPQKTTVSYGSASEKDLGKTTMSYSFKDMHDHGNNNNNNGNEMVADVFFFHDVLRPGTVITPTIPPTTSLPSLLPRRIADTIPFCTERYADIVEMFAPAWALSPATTKEIRWTLDICEHPRPLPGEKAGCATSLEALVEIPAALLGTCAVRAFSGDMPVDPDDAPARRGRHAITAVRKLSESPEVLTCHDLVYPYAVFYCHTAHLVETYAVTLVAEEEDGAPAPMEVLAVCHLDTSEWDPENPFFVAHNLKPGDVAVCHFLPKLSIIWVPTGEPGDARDAK
ncbi:hypothetical protein ACP70R_047254 [Stipagrostis hirtigluma subsp. patula]